MLVATNKTILNLHAYKLTDHAIVEENFTTDKIYFVGSILCKNLR